MCWPLPNMCWERYNMCFSFSLRQTLSTFISVHFIIIHHNSFSILCCQISCCPSGLYSGGACLVMSGRSDLSVMYVWPTLFTFFLIHCPHRYFIQHMRPEYSKYFTNLLIKTWISLTFFNNFQSFWGIEQITFFRFMLI